MRSRIDLLEQIVTCTNCELHAQCKAPVPWRGQPSLIVAVGEAPGAQEDEQGRPFVGPAGKEIMRLFSEAGIDAAQVAFVNSVSCFPHGTPAWDHVQACAGNKWDQIDFLDPTYLLLLGRVALRGVRPDLDLKRGRSRPFMHRNRICYATYHPAAALRNNTFEAALLSDLEQFRDLVEAGPDRWNDFIPPACSACSAEAEWWEADSGIGWCPQHLPASEQPLYEARTALVAQDLADARKRAAGRRDGALAAVEANADPEWLRLAWDTLIEYLRTHEELFVDDLWAETGLPAPREARALGPVVLKAARDGLMVKSGEFRPSIRSNLQAKPVWTSLIYEAS